MQFYFLLLFVLCAHAWQWEHYTPSNVIDGNITGHSVFSSQGYLYSFGGRIKEGVNIRYTNSVKRFDFDTDLWATVSTSGDVPEGRTFHAYALSEREDRFYIYGGLTYPPGASFRFFQDFRYLDLEDFTWHSIPVVGLTTPGVRVGSSMQIVRGDILLANGFSTFDATGNPVYKGDLWKFDLDTNIWTLLSDNQPPRGFGQSAVLLSRFFVNGGEYYNQSTGYVALNDTRYWRKNLFAPSYNWYVDGGNQPTAGRYFACSAMLYSFWVMHGGELSGNQVSGCGSENPMHLSNQTWVRMPVTGNWKLLNLHGSNVPGALQRHSCARVEGKGVCLFGGYDFKCPGAGYTYNNDIYCLNIHDDDY